MFAFLCHCQDFYRTWMYIWVTRPVSCNKQKLRSPLVYWWGPWCSSVLVFCVVLLCVFTFWRIWGYLPKRWSESVNWRSPDDTIVTSKKTKRQTTIYKTLHRKHYTENITQKTLHRKHFTENITQKTLHRKHYTEN